MSIVKLNNRSVKDITAFGSISSLGSLTHIATQTASSSASVSFTSGIDSTYKEYIFYFVNIHPNESNKYFGFNMSSDSGSNYNVTKTTTLFRAIQAENDSFNNLGYRTGDDLAQNTGLQTIMYSMDNDNDSCGNGFLHIFNPSSSVFVKHFISNSTATGNDGGTNRYNINYYVGGYGNTTSPIDAIQFKMSSGNIDSGQILLFGLN